MATGQTLVTLLPLANEPPVTDFATLDLRNNHPVLDFDDTTNEFAVWTGTLPTAYAGGGVTVRVGWAGTTATSGNVEWMGEFERVSEDLQDMDSSGFTTGVSAVGSAPGTSGRLRYTSIAFTNGAQMDSLAAGEMFRFRITRNATSGSDTMVGDAELAFVEIRET